MASSLPGPSMSKIFLKYDVFINHRGPDTKDQFVVPLIDKLRQVSIQTFLDRQDIHHGDHVFGTIEEAIRTASLYVIVFSRNYAESTYCLSELHQMLLTGRTIVPIFYDVQPEHVRRPRNPHGPFAEAFMKHDGRQKREVVGRWVSALEAAAEISGFVRTNYSDDDELLRSEIVQEVESLLRPQTLKVPPSRGQYDWNRHFKMPSEGRGIVSFAANTYSNLHIAFSPESRIMDPMYEIVIGWNDNWSEIRRQTQGRSFCFAPFSLRNRQPGGLHHFWVSMDAERQLVQVGEGDQPCQKDAFLSYKDPAFLSSVHYFSFSSHDVAITYTNIQVKPRRSTLDNSNDFFTKCLWARNLSDSLNLPITTQAMYGRYDWSKPFRLPTEGRGMVCFAAKGPGAVHLAISPRPQTMDAMYEIVIGGWDNTESAIRRQAQGGCLSRVKTAGVINSHVGGLYRFWVSLNAETKLIHVGQGSQPDFDSVFCTYKDLHFLSEARYVSFTSWAASITYSDICVASPCQDAYTAIRGTTSTLEET